MSTTTNPFTRAADAQKAAILRRIEKASKVLEAHRLVWGYAPSAAEVAILQETIFEAQRGGVPMEAIFEAQEVGAIAAASSEVWEMRQARQDLEGAFRTYKLSA